MADKAILCGINSYESISGLKGCLSDLGDVQRLLIDSYGFLQNNIQVYRDEQVIKSAIEKGFDWLAADTGPGDRVVFHFSGHGSYTKSSSPEKAVDEVLCLWNMSWTDESSFLRDSDLGVLTRKITSGAKLTVILDSCHSGTGTKAFTSGFRGEAKSVSPKNALVIIADTAQRLIVQEGGSNLTQLARSIERAEPAALTKLKSEDNPPVFARFVEPPSIVQEAITTFASSGRQGVHALGQTTRNVLNHQLLAAADEKQTAADAFIDGQYRGAFSFNLCAAARTSSNGTFQEVMQLTAQRIKQQGFSQDPKIDGPFSHQVFLGETDINANSPSNTSLSQPQNLTTWNFSSEAGDLKIASSDPGQPAPLAILERLLRVSEKLVDLATLAAPPQRLTATIATPPSKSIRDFVVDTNLLAIGSPPGNSGAPTAQTRDVIGKEDRERVSDVLVQPFCWICQILSSTDGEARKNAGSGAFIGPRTILTAAHNLYVLGRRARRFEIYLAVNGDRSAPPLGAYVATQAIHHPDYNDAADFDPSDVAVIHLDKPLPAVVTNYYGTMPFVPIAPSQWTGKLGMVSGYPRDYPKIDPNRPDLYPEPEIGVQAFQYYCRSKLTHENGLLRYTLDTTFGQSGGPLIGLGLINGQERSVCIGVHVQGKQSGNASIPLDQQMYRWVADRLAEVESGGLV